MQRMAYWKRVDLLVLVVNIRWWVAGGGDAAGKSTGSGNAGGYEYGTVAIWS